MGIRTDLDYQSREPSYPCPVDRSRSEYIRGQIGYKSKTLKIHQHDNPVTAITYADKANERLSRKYYRMVLRRGKKGNVAKTAVARELSCYIWGMMTDNTH